MNEELEQLQKIGAQRIYEETHIPLLTVQALLHSSYDSFTRVHFLGFISILEREYKLELPQMKATGLAHFDAEKELEEEEGVFVVAKESHKKTYLLVITLIIFVIGILYQIFVVNKEEDVKIVDNTKIEELKKSIAPIVVENNSTEKVVMTTKKKEKLKVVAAPKEQVVAKVKSLVIQSKSKVWFGYINIVTNKKSQRTFHGSTKLDPSKSWLLIFGHGYINIVINGKIHKFTSPNTVRFLYKDGRLKEIDAKEFKELNRGSKW